MRLAAAQKTGRTSWRQIFQEATVEGATVGMFGDALVSLLLFPNDQINAKVADALDEASLNLIRIGDKSRIPEMVDLLNRYGNTTVALNYLNSSQQDLVQAAERWAKSNGYRIDYIQTSKPNPTAAWGGGR